MGKVSQRLIDQPEFYDDQQNMRMNTEPSIEDHIAVLDAESKSYLESALEGFEFYKDPNGGTLDKIDAMESIQANTLIAFRSSTESLKLLKKLKREEEEAEIRQEEIDREEYEIDMSHQAGLLREKLYLF